MVDWHPVPEGEYKLPSETNLKGLIVVGEDLRYTLEEVATATTLTADHFLVVVDTSSTNITITLPASALHKHRVYTIKNIGTGKVTIDANGSETIDGETTIELTLQYSYVTIVCDGDEWFIIGGEYVKMEDLLREILDELKTETDKLKEIKEQLEILK